MSAPLVSEGLWATIAPLIPPAPPKPKGGRPRVSDRATLTGILLVLRGGIPWELLPVEMGGGCGMTCWRRLKDWQEAGVWGKAPPCLARPAWLGGHHRWTPGGARQRQRPGKRGGQGTGPNPTDRGKPGTQRPVLTDANGIPLALALSPANGHDRKLLETVIDTVPPIQQRAGRPRRRPAKRHADKACDCPHRRRALRRRAITPHIARRGIDRRERLGRHRWVVERPPT